MALNSLVVSDSTSIISLINIERFELLFKFSETLVITEAVYAEVAKRKTAKKHLNKYIADKKIIIRTVDDKKKVVQLLTRLDLGESESIVLAKQERLPLIIDEKRGRNIAKSLGVVIIGLVGILLVYKEKDYLAKDEMKIIVAELKEVEFRISQPLLDLLLA